jgi:ribulose-phosphate 3-epimerase
MNKVSPVLPQDEEYRLFAKFIADDLFRFMESFNKQTDARNELLLIPTKVLDMWYEKFNNKFKRDPFFWTRKDAP